MSGYEFLDRAVITFCVARINVRPFFLSLFFLDYACILRLVVLNIVEVGCFVLCALPAHN